MSILIKGMEMPNSCIACRFGKETNYLGDFEEKCLVNGKCGYISIKKPRLDTCPLTEIKEPHGDLVDLSDVVHPNDSMRRMTIDEQLRRTCEGWSADRKQCVVIKAEGSEA